MANRVYREAMQKSKCVHCVEAWFQNSNGDGKLRIIHMCDIDEWDDLTICRKGYCRYYSKQIDEKEEGKAK